MFLRKRLSSNPRRTSEASGKESLTDSSPEQSHARKRSSASEAPTYLTEPEGALWAARGPRSSGSRRTPSPSFARSPSRNDVRPASPTSSFPFRSKPTKPSRDSDPLGLTLLYAPEGPHSVDIIFVHGLGGSSRLTWCKEKDLDKFWPFNWLPGDQDLRQARIMTFGYSAKASSTMQSSSLGIADFSRNLLYDMAYGTDMYGSSLGLGKVPLIFVTHSMGGLVFKKAYLDGQLDNRYADLIASIKAVIFLSTPHRGANLAEYLSKVLSIVPAATSKQYVTELEKDGPFLKTINEQFRHAVSQLQIFSFYETLLTQIGFTSTMILDGESAKLGYPGEVSRSLHADHHDVCKFDSPQDTNYQVILAALKSIVTNLSSAENQESLHGNGNEKLEALLSVSGPPEHDLNLFWSRRAEDTCEWVMDRPELISWTLSPVNSAVLWLHGRPARGKSVLSSYIIHQLQEQGASVQYYFFRAGDETKQSLSSLIRSLAFQAANEVPSFRKFLIELAGSAWRPKEADWRTTWKKLFVNKLFMMDFYSPLYWVIDGVDESGSTHSFYELLEDLRYSVTPIRVIFTSRWSQGMASYFDRMSSKLPSSVMTIDEDLTDIQAFAEMELRYLSWGQQIKDEVMTRILEQSNDNFLWVHLILEEIKDCNTEDDVRFQLEQLPAGMDSLYRRIEENMASFRRPSDKSLCRQLLLWTVHARRSLSLDELAAILEPEFGKLLDLGNTISRLCGHFVAIEGNRQVGLLHQTAREYLIASSTLPFSLSAPEAHAELLEKSIAAFSNNSLRSKLTSVKIVDYRATAWVHHLNALKSPESGEQIDVLLKFFTQPAVLVWIHVLATLNQLKILIEASHCLAAFVQRQRRQDAVRDPAVRRFEDLELLDSWSRDLLKIPGKFGSNLSEDPDSIFHSIPAFCPQKSSVYKSFGASQGMSLRVKGLPEDWDDCLARVLIEGQNVVSIISCSGRYLAVVSTVGTISVCDCVTFHQVQLLEHGEPVSAICFNTKGNQLASYGTTTKIWSVQTGQLIHKIMNPASTHALCLQFTEDGTNLLAGMDRRCVLQASLDEEDAPAWKDINQSLLNDDASMEGTYLNTPTALAISPDGTKIAAAYRRFPLTIWSMVEPVMILKRVTRFGANQNQATTHLPFASKISWHPNSEELIGFFNDGYFFRTNLVDGTYQEHPPDPGQMPSDIQCSPDGLTYAICRYHGAIKLYDYQSSTLIYQLTAENMISAFCFGQDGRKFFDIRGSYCNVWQPSSLVRLFAADDHPTHSGSISAEESVDRVNPASEAFADDPTPTVLVAPKHDGSAICLGDDDGVLELLHWSSGTRLRIDKTVTGIAVEHLAWSSKVDCFCYSEISGRVTCVQIESEGENKFKYHRLGRFKPKPSPGVLKQLVVSPNSTLALLCYENSIALWSLSSFKLLRSAILDSPERTTKWTQHPTQEDYILAISSNRVAMHKWGDLNRLSAFGLSSAPVQNLQDSENANQHAIISLDSETIQESVENILPTHYGAHLIVRTSRRMLTRKLQSTFTIIDTTPLDPHHILEQSHSCLLQPVVIPDHVMDQVVVPLNILRNGLLVFVDKSFGLCTWNIRGQAKLQRHFFIPRDWLSVEKLSHLHVTAQGTILCQRQGGITVIESGIASKW